MSLERVPDRARRALARVPHWIPSFFGYLAFASAVFALVVFTWFIHSRAGLVRWPTLHELDTSFKQGIAPLADVGWHAGLVVNDYEPAAWEGAPYSAQRNWAYFPLTPYTAKLLRPFVGGDPFWALQVLTLLSVAALLTLVRETARRVDPARWSLQHELLLVFFVLPIAWPCANFIAYAMLMEFALMFALLRLARATAVQPSSVLLVGVLAFATAFSRSQGLILNVILAATVFVFLRGPKRQTFWTIVALLLPIPLVLVFYEWKVGDALAFYRIQKTWGRSFSMPWAPWIKEFKTGFVIGEFHDLAFSFLHAAFSLVAIVYTAYRCLRDRPQNEADRRERNVESGIVAASFVLWLLPSMTGVLLGMHRLYSFAMYPLVTPTTRNAATRVGPLLVMMICFLRMAELVFFFEGRIFAIW